MSLRILFLFCLSCLFSEPASAQALFPSYGKVIADRVNVRAGQNENFRKVADVKENDRVVALEESYGWLRVYLPKEAQIYISSKYVKVTAPFVGVVNADRVNLRSAMDIDASILGQVMKGQVLSIRENKGEWLWLEPLKEATGWVHGDYIEIQPGMVNMDGVFDFIQDFKSEVSSEPEKESRLYLLKDLGNKQVEVKGRFTQAGEDSYQMKQGDQVLCNLAGPEVVLNQFIDRDVIIQGVLEASVEENTIPKVRLLKIRLAL